MPHKDIKRDILRLIPIVLWNDMGVIKRYPYIVYRASRSTLDNDKIKEILDDVGSTNAIVFDSPDVTKEGNGYNITKADLTDEYYFSFWEEYQDIVLIELDNEDSALIAALYASELNAPLIFVNPNNIEDYKEQITDKIIHIIDTVEDMEELELAAERTSLLGSELRSQIVSERFNMLRSQVDID